MSDEMTNEEWLRTQPLYSRAHNCADEIDRLRRECDMRADDTLKLCKEIDGLNARLADEQAKRLAAEHEARMLANIVNESEPHRRIAQSDRRIAELATKVADLARRLNHTAVERDLARKERDALASRLDAAQEQMRAVVGTLHRECLDSGLITVAQWNEKIAPRLSALSIPVYGPVVETTTHGAQGVGTGPFVPPTFGAVVEARKCWHGVAMTESCAGCGRVFGVVEKQEQK